jgi:hypothetical protein
MQVDQELQRGYMFLYINEYIYIYIHASLDMAYKLKEVDQGLQRGYMNSLLISYVLKP